jgi:hypothetical protein
VVTGVAIEITDTAMVSDMTPHRADLTADGWRVTWCPTPVGRNQAITAMTIAEVVAQMQQEGQQQVVDPTHRMWPFIDSWAAELGFTGPDAVVRVSQPQQRHDQVDERRAQPGQQHQAAMPPVDGPASAAGTGVDALPDAVAPAWVDGYLTGHDRGVAEGAEKAYADYDRHLTTGLAQMLAGDPTVTDYTEGLRRHERQTTARARRDTADHAPAADNAAAGTSADAPARPVVRSAYEAGLYRLATDLTDGGGVPAGKPAEPRHAEHAAWRSYVDAVDRGDTTAARIAVAELAITRERLAASERESADTDADGW